MAATDYFAMISTKVEDRREPKTELGMTKFVKGEGKVDK
jgi:hypothetical protein